MTIYESDYEYTVDNGWVHVWGGGPNVSTTPLTFIQSKKLRQCSIFVCGPPTQERRQAMEAVVLEFRSLPRSSHNILEINRAFHELSMRNEFVMSAPALSTLELKAYIHNNELTDLRSTIAFRKVPDAKDSTDWITPTVYMNDSIERLLFGGMTFAELEFKHRSPSSISNRIREVLKVDDNSPCIRVSEMPASEVRVFVQWDDQVCNQTGPYGAMESSVTTDYKDPNIHHERVYDGPTKMITWLVSKAAKAMKVKEKELAKAAEKDKNKEVKAQTEDAKDEKKDQEEKHCHEHDKEPELGTGSTPALIDVITKQRTEARNILEA